MVIGVTRGHKETFRELEDLKGYQGIEVFKVKTVIWEDRGTRDLKVLQAPREH